MGELVFLVRAVFGKGGVLGILVTGILGSALLLVAPIYLYFRMSGSPFSGSHTFNGVSWTWSEGPGLFMAPFAAIFFLVATMLVFLLTRHVALPGSVRVSPS